MPRYDAARWHGASYCQDLYFPAWKIAEDHPLAAGGTHGIPCIGFGPGDEDKAHAPNEHTRIEDLVTSSAFYAMLPLALEKKGGG